MARQGKSPKYRQQQSSPAEISPREFRNKDHYGDFRGDTREMLRRGYDMHFHYANFGVRTLRTRFPQRLANEGAARPYLVEENLTYKRDKQGLGGGILSIVPDYEPDELAEIWNCGELLSRRSRLASVL